jgi:hypothetical protein
MPRENSRRLAGDVENSNDGCSLSSEEAQTLWANQVLALSTWHQLGRRGFRQFNPKINQRSLISF